MAAPVALPIKTAGNWNASQRHVYFIASNPGNLTQGAPAHDSLLVAVNELKAEGDLAQLAGWLGAEKRVFVDSGIFSLAMRHAAAHGISHDAALNLAPDEIDGFDNLLERYCAIVEQFGDKVWGYIELDQGGRENKIKTRARLEALGLRPIPVYHPFGDGWDYFDYLAERYDRICFGNIVQAQRATRLRLIATAWERKRKYPNLWIHLLGMTPNEWLYAMPIDSGDSSSWLSSVRWSPSWREVTAGKPIGGMPKNFRYVLGGDSDSDVGSKKATLAAAYGSYIRQLNWRNHLDSLQAEGFDLWPNP